MDKGLFTKEEVRLIWKAVVAFLFMLAAVGLSILTSCSHEDRMLYADRKHLIEKPVFVTNGAMLMIQSDALLEALPVSGCGKAALVISKGRRIIANGTEDSHIILTASEKKPGLWNGVILMDGAPVAADLIPETLLPEIEKRMKNCRENGLSMPLGYTMLTQYENLWEMIMKYSDRVRC